MTIIDSRGRLFGRVNLVDAAVAAFALALVPLAYGTYLLFQPVRPHIESVSPAEITKEERRVGSSLLRGKLKVKGTGFNPMLRARLGDVQALGFVFENPNSADVLVGPMAPGAHDLILLDGVQEVARAAGAVTIREESNDFVRAVGGLTVLAPETASTLVVGDAAPQPSPVFEIVSVGPPKAARSRVSLAHTQVDLPREGRVEREVVVNLRCSAPIDVNPCDTNGRPVSELAPLVVSLPDHLRFEIHELLPPTPPRRARIQVQVLGGMQARWPKAGDRDAFLDERAAQVMTVGAGEAGGIVLTIELGADESREGWRYRSQLLKPGAPFMLATDRYETRGMVVTVTLLDPPVGATR